MGFSRREREEREERVPVYVWLEVQYRAQIISWLFPCVWPSRDSELIRAREAEPFPSRSNQAGDLAGWTWKAGWLLLQLKDSGALKVCILFFFIPYLCLPPVTKTKQNKTKKVSQCLISPTAYRIFSILFVPQRVSHAMSNPLCSLGPHMIFSFTVSALSIMHWTHTQCVKIPGGGAIKSSLTDNENGGLHHGQDVRKMQHSNEIKDIYLFILCVCVCVCVC